MTGPEENKRPKKKRRRRKPGERSGQRRSSDQRERKRSDKKPRERTSKPLRQDNRSSQDSTPRSSEDSSQHEEPTLASFQQEKQVPEKKQRPIKPEPIVLEANLPPIETAFSPSTLGILQNDQQTKEQWADLFEVAWIRFHSAGRPMPANPQGGRYVRGQRVIVDTDRGTRVATVSTGNTKTTRNPKRPVRIVRLATAEDESAASHQNEQARQALTIAKRIAKKQRLPIKVYRTEQSVDGDYMRVYFSSEERIEYRNYARELSGELGMRTDLCQTGVRDEAKRIGGIGSCGQELCCSTWLPDFVPVSIKMAKDQGLALNPTKVSGQCGRLKCCLVYEQDMYAEMRKGLPKLGKRVIAEDDREGRVIEVNVLKQKIRVSFGRGESEVLNPDQIRPMFPSQNQSSSKKGDGSGKRRRRKKNPPKEE